MSDLEFGIVAEALPAYTLALMQNLSQEDQVKLGKQVGELVGSKMDERLKVLILGLLVMNAVGEDVLDSAVTSIKRAVPSSGTKTRRRGTMFGLGQDLDESPLAATNEPDAKTPASGAGQPPPPSTDPVT